MSEESEIVCDSCGAEVRGAAGAGQGVLCPACASQDNTQIDHSYDETLKQPQPATPAESLDEPVDQTVSFGSQMQSNEASSVRSKESIPKQIGRFKIAKVLGSGGFGTVYRAHDSLLDREVALKVPRLDASDERAYELFLHEAKAAARLRHPNIVAVFECGVVDNKTFIASEFVDGIPLSDILGKRKLPLREAVNLVRQVADALHYAHTEGIVHRDLKPGNIMMSKSGRPQVMDFGLARLSTDTEKSLMSEGSIVGTPAYMAPEQARGDRAAVGPKSDQYSIGVLMYVMLCGRRPYHGDAWSIISRVADPVVLPDTPRAVSNSVPRDLEACCLKAMEKDPDRRYDDLNAMADDLGHWLEGRPLLARPIGIREQLVRWCERNRLIAGLSGVITCLILAALVVGYVLAFKFSNLYEYASDRADAAEIATREAEIATREVERVLIDTFTEAGLDAGSSGRSQEAVLWFGSAAARAAEHPLREQLNRARFQTWLSSTPIPVRMFRGLGDLHKSLIVHPSGQYLMSEQRGPDGDDCQIWHVTSGQSWASPWDTLIQAAAWNADGNTLAIAAGSEVRLYRFPQGEEIDRWQHGKRVFQLLFTQDGGKIAVGGKSSCEIRELSEQPVSKTINVPRSVVGMAWNPSGNALATLCSDAHVHVWNGDPNDSGNQPLVSALSCPIESLPPPVQFVSDTLLVVPESNVAVGCWDISTGQSVWSIPCESRPSFTSSPDMSRVAIINRKELYQVDAQTGETAGPTITHDNLLYSAAYDSIGERLLTGCSDQFARIYSADTGELLSSMRHSDIVHRVAWFPGGDACVTAHWNADLVRVWRIGVSAGRGFTQKLPGGVMHVKWSDNGRWFIPCGSDQLRGVGACRVLATADGSPADAEISFQGRATDGCFIPGRNDVFVAGSATAEECRLSNRNRFSNQDKSTPGLIVAGNIETGERLFPPIPTDTNVIAIEPSRDGCKVVALCHDRKLLIIDSTTGEILHRHETFPESEFFYGYVIFRRIAFSPSGDRFAVWGSLSSAAEMRSAIDGSLLYTVAHTNDASTTWLQNVVFSPDGATFATCSSDQTVQLWKADSGVRLPTMLRHTGWVFSAQFSQDGNWLLTACQDRQARLWNLADAEKPMMATPPQADEVYATCFLPGEEAFLIGLRNGEVSAWDIKHGKMIAPGSAEPGQEAVYTLAVSPDQSRVIVVSKDANVRGYEPTRWQPQIDNAYLRGELQSLGEMIASQELNDGVLIGLTNEAVIDRWQRLFAAHAEHRIFHWPDETHDAVSSEQPDGYIDASLPVLESETP